MSVELAATTVPDNDSGAREPLKRYAEMDETRSRGWLLLWLHVVGYATNVEYRESSPSSFDLCQRRLQESLHPSLCNPVI